MSVNSLRLDIVYRWMFGMIDYDTAMGLFKEYGLFDITQRIRLPPKIHFDAKVGFACGNDAVTPPYSEHFDPAMKCADIHSQHYHSLMDSVGEVMEDNGAVVVFVDLANMMRGTLHDYMADLDLLPIIYKHRPVIYIVITPTSDFQAQASTVHNKVIVPVACMIPGYGPCYPRGVGETDDLLLIMLHNYLKSRHPEQTYILSGDNYWWSGTENLPELKAPTRLRLERHQLGLSEFRLRRASRPISRLTIFAVDRHDQGVAEYIQEERAAAAAAASRTLSAEAPVFVPRKAPASRTLSAEAPVFVPRKK